MAASSGIYTNGLKVAITVALIITIFLMPSGFAVNSGGLQQSEMVLGSKPPGCVNECSSCRPCMATLVIPTHKWKKNFEKVTYEDESYYLLAWKCKCGDQLFQP
ncbi:26.5 kDa heat shock protein [Hibiscus syriacus]|uniref:Epidermal patterning factor-like protein n=1 Tax=Hibiscus syriacus TaxID=106335 RepID=A0A6A2ZYD1_HIBSY|nr:EPIDERMAL PATTERNING FACTOR-like protein 8 [Hibiscus syriacus]KAE8696122.1 26.5 kDa heat shock protein [Hibiscus syriacus]